MTQIALQVFAAVTADIKCPFCEAKKPEKNKETLTIINDSKKLGKNTQGPLNVGINHPDPGGQAVPLEVKKAYLIDGTTSQSIIGQNAHHVIPGNASFAKVPKLHKWLAWELKIQKKWYSQKVKDDVGLIKSCTNTLDDGTCVIESRSVEKRTSNGARLLNVKHTKGHKVYGNAGYDINSSANGIWLPSNNAINNWSALSESYKRKYAKLAMVMCKAQFHDAHPTYSNSVLNELKAIEAKLDQLATDCLEHDDSDTDPYPVPLRIKLVLDTLAKTIARTKLKGRKGKTFEEDWSTSSFAANFKIPKT